MSVARNTIFLTGAMVVQKVMSLVYFAALARYLGVESTGAYSFALSFTTLCAILSDFGLTPAMTRVIAGEGSDKMKLVSAGLWLKIMLMAVAVAVVLIVGLHRGYDVIVMQLLPLAAIVMMFDAVHTLFYGMLRGMRLLKYESLGMVLGQLAVIIAGGTAIFFNASLPYFVGALIGGSVLNVAISGWVLHKKGMFKTIELPEKNSLKKLFNLSLLFGLAGVFARGYSQLDVVLLQDQLGSAAVGAYAVASKVVFALQFIPIALSASLFPAIAHAINDQVRMRSMVVKSLKYLGIVAIPLSVMLGGFSSLLVLQVFGVAYTQAIAPLSILALSLVFGFLDYPLGAYLNGSGRTGVQTTALGVTLAVNIVANIFFISRWGVVGSAYAALISQSVLFGFGVIATWKFLNVEHGHLLWYFVKIVILSIAAIFVAREISSHFTGIISLCLGLASYGILLVMGLFGLRLIRISELKQLRV